MPYTIFVPDYDEESGRRIIDQNELRIRNAERTPEDRQLAHESLKAQDEAAKAANQKAAEEAKKSEEFRVNSRAAQNYGITPDALKPASLGIAQMLDAEQDLNAEFEAKKQELGQKYQGPDVGSMARELDELHQKQDAELAAQFGSNSVAEQAIAQRNQEFRAGASAWLQTEIRTKQQQYFDTVDKKCNDSLAAQINAMQPEQISSALQTRENEMRALGRTPEQIGAARQTLLGSYFQNLANTNPSAFIEATASPGLAAKQPQAKDNGEAGDHADNSTAASLQNPLADLTKSLSEAQLNKFSRIAERSQMIMEKKEKLAKINLRQQEILQNLTGLDPDDQRSEIETITAGLEDKEMAETLKTRLNLQLDYEDQLRAARDWESGDKIISQDIEPLQKLEMIAEADMSEKAREALIREVMGEATPETPENQQAALDVLLKINSNAIQTEQQLHALFQQQNLTRSQAAFLTEVMNGEGRVNGVPVGMALSALQKHDPGLAEKPGEFFGGVQELLRDWPEDTLATYKNVAEQAAFFEPANLDDSCYQGIPALPQQLKDQRVNMRQAGFDPNAENLEPGGAADGQQETTAYGTVSGDSGSKMSSGDAESPQGNAYMNYGMQGAPNEQNFDQAYNNVLLAYENSGAGRGAQNTDALRRQVEESSPEASPQTWSDIKALPYFFGYLTLASREKGEDVDPRDPKFRESVWQAYNYYRNNHPMADIQREEALNNLAGVKKDIKQGS